LELAWRKAEIRAARSSSAFRETARFDARARACAFPLGRGLGARGGDETGPRAPVATKTRPPSESIQQHRPCSGPSLISTPAFFHQACVSDHTSLPASVSLSIDDDDDSFSPNLGLVSPARAPL
jgi:hypothetical protein